MKTAKTQRSVNLGIVLMHVGQQLVESMQFALAPITEEIANVYRVLGEIPLQLVHHVRFCNSKVNLIFGIYFSNTHKCMFACYFSVPPPTEPVLDVGCSTNDECPDYAACENRQCINPCAFKNPCAPTANCRVVRHSPICTCPDGYVGSPTTSCQLRKKEFF